MIVQQDAPSALPGWRRSLIWLLRRVQVYRGFESWATGSDWTAAMPAGEDALAVAAGKCLSWLPPGCSVTATGGHKQAMV